MATGRLAFALDGRASHQGCSGVSAATAGAGCVAAMAPNPAPAVAALMNPLRPSTDGRDARSNSFITSCANTRQRFQRTVGLERADGSTCGRERSGVAWSMRVLAHFGIADQRPA